MIQSVALFCLAMLAAFSETSYGSEMFLLRIVKKSQSFALLKSCNRDCNCFWIEVHKQTKQDTNFYKIKLRKAKTKNVWSNLMRQKHGLGNSEHRIAIRNYSQFLQWNSIVFHPCQINPITARLLSCHANYYVTKAWRHSLVHLEIKKSLRLCL